MIKNSMPSWEQGTYILFRFEKKECSQVKLSDKKMHRRDRGDHREKHFVKKKLCVLSALCGE